MSYRILARKYRPRTFAEVIGQDHIVTALTRAIEKGRVGQAYLLVGPRGTGKTSTARILAKTLNCEQGMSITPCLECFACKEIEGGNDSDVVEIDGASNNGVDDVRALRERVHYRPLRDRHKIYIIDEVQRLSGPAFDALLKTLEEPPDHALFLFATTDPHKIPDTIVSRCQVFEFRRLREVDILEKLTTICQLEQQEVPVEVLSAISRGCRGGLRDAESMLDQILAVADGIPTLDDLEMIAGLARPERWLTLFEAVAIDDGGAVLKSVDEFLQRGGSERDFVQQAVDALRDLLHLVLLGADALGVEPAPDRRERSLKLAGQLGRDRLEAMLAMLFGLEARINRAPLAARALLEWTLLRAARLQVLMNSAALLGDIQAGRPVSIPAAAVAPPAPKTTAGSASGMGSAVAATSNVAATSAASTTFAAPATPTPAATPTPPASPTTPAALLNPVTAATAPASPAVAASPKSTNPAPGTSAAARPPASSPFASSPAAASPPPQSPPSVVSSFHDLMDEFRKGRPTAAKVVDDHLAGEGQVKPDGVHIILQEPDPTSCAIVEDPVLLKYLAKLPGSPGPWKIEYMKMEAVMDPIADQLREGFDGLEELP